MTVMSVGRICGSGATLWYSLEGSQGTYDPHWKMPRGPTVGGMLLAAIKAWESGGMR